MKDPYQVLGVSRTASADEIKSAYRKLAKKLHPDLNPGDSSVEQKFKEVSQAYSILGDSAKRKRFDRGEIDASGQETGAREGGFYRTYAESGQGAKYDPFHGGFGAGVDDIFADLFRGARRSRQRTAGQRTVRRRGADVTYKANVSFDEAAVGAKKRIVLADGKALDVNIPPGTEEGQTLRLKGKGMAGLGGAPAGDAFIEVHIEPHAYFTRQDNDIHLELPITLQEAVAGATVQVPTLHGKVSMKIPAGANSGTTLRLKGKGIADPKDGRKGDQYVKTSIVLPDTLDSEFRDFVERWGPAHPYDPRRKAGLS